MQEIQETQVRFLSYEDPLEEGKAIHSSILAWRIPWTEESGGLQPSGHKDRTGLNDLATVPAEKELIVKTWAGSLGP